MASWPVAAQDTPDQPVGEKLPWGSDSGLRANAAVAPAAVYRDAVRIDGSAWVRLYFGKVSLSPGSVIRLTSVLDGEVQELDAMALAMWNDSSAYFNGDAVMIELIAAPRTTGNRVIVEQVAWAPMAVAVGEPGECGICIVDDRLSSSEVWSCRLLPGGCTASIYNTDSCLVSAGHCVNGTTDDVIEFNVPNSNGNCSLNHPPIADQFPITAKEFIDSGVGDDWSVLIPGTNNLGEKPYERYGELRPIASTQSSKGQAAALWGYGVNSTCAQSQTQQTSSGTITNVSSTWYEFNVDLRNGNSGSAVIEGGEIVAVVTHCSYGCPNYSTRVDERSFESARATLCSARPACPGDCGVRDGEVDILDVLDLLGQWGGGGGSCDIAPIGGNGIVDILDLLDLLGGWGPCE